MADPVPVSLTNALHNILPILRAVNSLKSFERTVHEIIEQMVKDFNCTTCAVVVINPVTEMLNIKSFYGLSWNFCKTFQKRIDTPIIKEMIWKGEPISVSNSSFNPVVGEELKLERDFASCYAIPITVNQKPMGYLQLESDQTDNFSSEMQMLAKIYANLIGITLFREELAEELKRLEYKDRDSGAVKYSHFFPRLQEMFQQAERLHDPISAILIDIEGYGGILKTYGIDSTHAMMQELVAWLKSALRKYDGLSRFGTDEFLIILPGTRLHEAKKAGEKIKSFIAEKEFTDKKLRINCFISAASYPENCSTLDGLLTALRSTLLEAKRSNLINEVVALKKIVD
jgi:diguanylate cyclase (GGDEF)-like protein